MAAGFPEWWQTLSYAHHFNVLQVLCNLFTNCCMGPTQLKIQILDDLEGHQIMRCTELIYSLTRNSFFLLSKSYSVAWWRPCAFLVRKSWIWCTCVLKPKTKTLLISLTSYIFANFSLISAFGTFGLPGCKMSMTCTEKTTITIRFNWTSL